MMDASINTMPVRDRDTVGVPGITTNGAVQNNGNHHIKTWDDGDDSPSFSDFIDTINPLQHIPIVNTIYRHLTGDTEGAAADLAGGALWGGPIGLALAGIGLSIEDQSGEDPGEMLYAAVFGDDKQGDSGTAVAQNSKTGQTGNADEDGDTPPAPAAAPREAVSLSNADDGAGPVKSGDYLVFGGNAAGSTRPVTSASAAAAAAAASVGPAHAAKNQRPAISAADSLSRNTASGQDGLTRQGDYVVFGSQTAPQASPQVAAAAETPDITSAVSAEASPMQSTLNRATNRNGPLNPLPARRNITPPGTLPLPTTGPGAVPGGHSQALGNKSAQPSNDWFADAFNRNMDKYDGMKPSTTATGAYDAAAQTNAATNAAATIN